MAAQTHDDAHVAEGFLHGGKAVLGLLTGVTTKDLEEDESQADKTTNESKPAHARGGLANVPEEKHGDSADEKLPHSSSAHVGVSSLKDQVELNHLQKHNDGPVNVAVHNWGLADLHPTLCGPAIVELVVVELARQDIVRCLTTVACLLADGVRVWSSAVQTPADTSRQGVAEPLVRPVHLSKSAWAGFTIEATLLAPAKEASLQLAAPYSPDTAKHSLHPAEMPADAVKQSLNLLWLNLPVKTLYKSPAFLPIVFGSERDFWSPAQQAPAAAV